MDDKLGDRMKMHEQEAQPKPFDKSLPTLLRLDGRHFHSYTKSMKKPFDQDMVDLMRNLTEELVKETGALVGYTQSDEIQLLLYNPKENAQMFFGGKMQKLVSVCASFAGGYFNRHAPWGNKKIAQFDCRAWQTPSKEAASDAFRWRYMDCIRNAIMSAGYANFSHKALHGKDTHEIVEALREKGVIFSEYPDYFKFGTFVRRVKTNRTLTVEEIKDLPPLHKARKDPDMVFERWIIERNSVVFCDILDPIAFLFGSLGYFWPKFSFIEFVEVVDSWVQSDRIQRFGQFVVNCMREKNSGKFTGDTELFYEEDHRKALDVVASKMVLIDNGFVKDFVFPNLINEMKLRHFR